MSEWMSDREPNTEEEKPRFNRSKVVRIVISILVAIAMWLYVDLERAPERTMTIRDIPVEFSGENTTLADKNLMLLSGYDTTIDLKIRGPKRELVKMNRDNVRVIASTSSIDSVGVHQLDWTVSFPDGVVRTNVSVEKASLSQITVTVGELYTKEVPVECHVVGEVAEGYFTGDVVLDPEVLTLRAQRDDLLNVSCAKLTVDISGATRSVVQTVDVQLYDYDGNPVENSNIRTNTSLIQAKVPVLTTREVELAVEFSGVPGAAMNSIKCDITPKTVRLNGEADVLDSIDKLVLATLHVDDLELHQQNSYVVTPPDGTWLVNGNEVATADITLEGIEEKSLTATSIEFDKLPSGLYAIAPDGGLTVRLWGLSEEIEAVTAENLRVIADMSAVTGQGTVTVPVTVTISGFNDVTVRGTYELTVTVTDVAPTVPETAEGAAASHPAA
ncbi:CdaR family protein [Vescimonas sp.]|uniref:CdaR family protein n=1 Tax=Vescimonas sp. TaxID=2892404 RepID=UPI003F7F9224